MKAKIEKVSKFSYSANMKWICKGHTYECPGRQMHSFPRHFLVLMLAGIVAKLHPII